MKVAVLGAGGSVGEFVIKILKERNYESVAVIGDTNRVQDMEKMGATDVVIGSDDNFEEMFSECDAVIYVAGASTRSGETKNVLVDHKEVIDSAKAAKKKGIDRFVMLSAVRAAEGEDSRSTGAKEEPEELLRQEGFTFTIIRPGQLVDKPGKGTIEAAENLDSTGEISKVDVASVLVEALENKAAYNKTFEIKAGETDIKEAF